MTIVDVFILLVFEFIFHQIFLEVGFKGIPKSQHHSPGIQFKMWNLNPSLDFYFPYSLYSKKVTNTKYYT